jgi:ABC-type amino acid transport system permease subunit
VRRGLRRFGRWLAVWGRRLAPSPFVWVGIVLGFGTSLLVWESVLLLGIVLWLLGVWLWKTRGTPVLVALGLGIVLGWLPMLFFIVGSLPHTMIGLPGVEYDL